MPRYDYDCGRCGRREEHIFSMADMPATVQCPCGSEAARALDANVYCFLKNADYVFKMEKNVMTNAPVFGRSDLAEHDHYVRKFDEMKSMQRQNKASRKRGGQWLGSMPGAMADSIARHEGDPSVLQKDPVTFLKKTGLYQGDD